QSAARQGRRDSAAVSFLGQFCRRRVLAGVHLPYSCRAGPHSRVEAPYFACAGGRVSLHSVLPILLGLLVAARDCKVRQLTLAAADYEAGCRRGRSSSRFDLAHSRPGVRVDPSFFSNVVHLGVYSPRAFKRRTHIRQSISLKSENGRQRMRLRRFWLSLPAVLLLPATAFAQVPADPKPLAREILKQLIEINTTDSVGNVTTAAEA